MSQPAANDCPSRMILDQITGKWSILILAALCTGPLRFNELKRALDGVTQKALSQTLKRLERNGIVERCVIPTPPIGVEYSVTPLGQSLKQPFQVLHAWAIENEAAVQSARDAYDARELAGGIR